eukprot:TRINITY_DN31657_c0_g1_i1.p1 TRINITY_DN31657_c0_g1~~TRINITY_DN31657_c0_g1_i1.p1  ORF type:complete len:354 (+),score=70.66 TRINITY_DN31657_c0_g1_i1:102-1163(+)
MLGLPPVVLGTACCAASNAFTALGLITQKYSHQQVELSRVKTKYYKQPWWLVGMFVFIIGQVLNVGAMALTPQTMLSCLGGLCLVFNAVFARLILGEQTSSLEAAALIGIIGGGVLVVLGTPEQPYVNKAFAGEVVDPLLAFPFVAVALSLAAGISTLALASKFLLPSLKPIVWALTCSSCGSYSVTFFKCCSELLAMTSHVWKQPELYCLLGLALCSALLQVHSMNCALRWGEAVQVMPAFFALGVLFQLCLAELAFHELDGLSGFWNVLTFALGVGLVIASTVAIVYAGSVADEEEEKAATPLLMEGRSTSLSRSNSMFAARSLAATSFSGSFEDVERFYTVPVTGSMGVA